MPRMPKMICLVCTVRAQFHILPGSSKVPISSHYETWPWPRPAFVSKPPVTVIRDSGCAPPPLPAAVFLSIQWLRLPREILLSVFDIPVQKRNSDNGIFDPFQEIVSGEGRVKISSTFRHFLHPLSFFANDTNTHTHMPSKLEKFSSSPDLILEG